MSSSSTALDVTYSQVVQGTSFALMGTRACRGRILGVDKLQQLHIVHVSHLCNCKDALVCRANWPKLVFVGVGNCDERLLVLAYVLPHLRCTSDNMVSCTVGLVLLYTMKTVKSLSAACFTMRWSGSPTQLLALHRPYLINVAALKHLALLCLVCVPPPAVTGARLLFGNSAHQAIQHNKRVILHPSAYILGTLSLPTIFDAVRA